jgi:hypothetical protein
MRRYDGNNNGIIGFGGQDGAHAKLSRDVTERALTEIECARFSVMTEPAIPYLMRPRKWRLTMYPADGKPATKDFMKVGSVPQQNSFHGELHADDSSATVNPVRITSSPLAAARSASINENPSISLVLPGRQHPSSHPRILHVAPPSHPRAVHKYRSHVWNAHGPGRRMAGRPVWSADECPRLPNAGRQSDSVANKIVPLMVSPDRAGTALNVAGNPSGDQTWIGDFRTIVFRVDHQWSEKFKTNTNFFWPFRPAVRNCGEVGGCVTQYDARVSPALVD